MPDLARIDLPAQDPAANFVSIRISNLSSCDGGALLPHLSRTGAATVCRRYQAKAFAELLARGASGSHFSLHIVRKERPNITLRLVEEEANS